MEETTTQKKENGWKWATLVLAVVLVAVVFYMIGARNNSGSATGNVVNNNPSQQQVQPTQVSAGDSVFIGPDNAKTTVIEFSDFQCPFCGAAAGTNTAMISQFKSQDSTWQAAEPELVKLANQGKIKLVFRNFPLTSIHPYAEKAAEAAQCARDQGKFWEYHDLLFQHQDALQVSDLKNYAQQLGLDTATFNQCLDSGQKAAVAQKDTKDGISAGVQGTPTFFINGQKIEGAQSFTAFQSALGL